MIAFIQRVLRAEVTVGAESIGRIGPGVLALIGVRADDTPDSANRLAQRLTRYRIFADDAGRMNRDLLQVGGAALLVPQFTLCADTRRGLRPSFSGAAPPEHAAALFDHAVAAMRTQGAAVATGRFGAHMQVSLVNDGPVSFWLECGTGTPAGEA